MPQGRVLIPLDEDQVRAVVGEAVKDGIDAIAILFLHSYRNPAHEQRAKAIIARPNGTRAVRLGLARIVAGISRVRALLDGCGQCLCRPARAQLSLGDEPHLREADFDGTFLIVQSTGGLFDRR